MHCSTDNTHVLTSPPTPVHKMCISLLHRLLRLISPMDVDAVLDVYISQGLDRDPYWCRAWPSAICLAQQLLQRPELVAGRAKKRGRESVSRQTKRQASRHS